MSWLRPRLRLPLLAKELAEQAARKRTYALRVLYAVGLAAAFFIFLAGFLGTKTWSPLGNLGAGRRMFEFLVAVQFIGIYAFLPAMMSGAVAYEKERNSLELLFLTGMRPWEIVLQKYLGRLIPMFTLLLLSLPLLAIAYAFGGVSAGYLVAGVYFLLLACLQVGAFALMLSCFCRSTLAAFIASYVLGAVLFLMIVPGVSFFLRARFYLGLYSPEAVMFLFPPVLFLQIRNQPLGKVLSWGAPSLMSAIVFLGLARWFLTARAFVRRRSLVLSVFRNLDLFWDRVNKFAGGIVLIKEPDTLPSRAPVAWREVHKRPLGKVSHLIRLFLMIEVPVLLVAAVLVGEDPRSEAPSAFLFLLWCFALLMLAAVGASLFASERTGGTLELLLVTPLSGRDIVLQKMRRLWRCALVLAAPLVTIVLVRAYLTYTYRHVASAYRAGGLPLYLVSSLLAIAVYLPLFSYLSVLIGLAVRTRARAILGAVSAVVLWCGLSVFPMLLVSQVHELARVSASLSGLFFLSPAFVVVATELPYGGPGLPNVWPVLVNAGWYGMICFGLRRLCLVRADRYLGRIAAAGRRQRRQRPAAVDGGG